MSGGQIAALIFAILLLLPGGCFLVFGISFVAGGPYEAEAAPLFLAIAAVLLAVAAPLFWLAFRRRPGPGASANAPPPDC